MAPFTVLSQIARFMWPTWSPPGSCRPHVGPMLTPWTLLSGLWPGQVSHLSAGCYGSGQFTKRQLGKEYRMSIYFIVLFLAFSCLLWYYTNDAPKSCSLNESLWIVVETMVVHLTLDFFNNNSNHSRMCVLSTLCGNVDIHSPFDIYIYIYWFVFN